MRLCELLNGLDYEIVSGCDVEADDISYDSRNNTKGTVYVSISGKREYIEEAICGGAVCIIVEKEVWKNLDISPKITVVTVSDTRHALAIMSSNYFYHPEKRLKIIGITGTKGKTTTAYMIHTILVSNGYKVGLIGTIETVFNEEWYPTANTTPESYIIYETFNKMVMSGIKIVVMEVSSQALKMKRCDGIIFDIGVFTNISCDHIGEGEHKSFEEYLICKSKLFEKSKLSIINKDDEFGKYMASHAIENVKLYSIKGDADYVARDVALRHDGALECVEYKFCGPLSFLVSLNTPGIFNVYNSLCAISVASTFKICEKLTAKAVLDTRIKGRLEVVPTIYPFTIMIDYAHNESALRNLLECLRESKPKRIICCFGCGGNRDKRRRSAMGKVSGELSDITIITSDNPRYESPEAIIADIVRGVESVYGSYMIIPDRKKAIEYAIKMGKTGDIIVFAGKGHEDYQEIGGKKIPLNERLLIRDIQNGKA